MSCSCRAAFVEFAHEFHILLRLQWHRPVACVHVLTASGKDSSGAAGLGNRQKHARKRKNQMPTN